MDRLLGAGFDGHDLACLRLPVKPDILSSARSNRRPYLFAASDREAVA